MHDHWEEVYVVQGDLVVATTGKEGKGGEQSFARPTPAARPACTTGPFTSRNGCVLHEIHYYETSGNAQNRK